MGHRLDAELHEERIDPRRSVALVAGKRDRLCTRMPVLVREGLVSTDQQRVEQVEPWACPGLGSK